MQGIYISYAISGMSIVLGFIALLTQRIYVDTNTQKTIQMEIPILGKMKTNYPALAFVFLGFVLALVAVNKTPEQIPKMSPANTGIKISSFRLKNIFK